jgi:hypothetical protein
MCNVFRALYLLFNAKKTNVISWPWYERFGYLFVSNIKINGVPQMLIRESPLLIDKFRFLIVL